MHRGAERGLLAPVWGPPGQGLGQQDPGGRGRGGMGLTLPPLSPEVALNFQAQPEEVGVRGLQGSSQGRAAPLSPPPPF